MPTIKNKKIIAETNLFKITELDIHFDRNTKRKYEVISGHGQGAVMVIPIHKRKLLFIKEYAAGIDQYTLSFPKGRIDKGEEVIEAANRELQEEIGFKANKLLNIFTLNLAPGYIDHQTYVVLAEELEPSKLEGDEPEDLEIVECDFRNINDLICKPTNHIESRAIACVYLLQNYINTKA